jgi:hypothetical protein
MYDLKVVVGEGSGGTKKRLVCCQYNSMRAPKRDKERESSSHAMHGGFVPTPA